MRSKNEGKANSFLVWSIAFLALVILGIFGYSISKEISKKRQVEGEISALKDQAGKIQKDNVALEDKISYLSSKDYQEMQAKEKLNLQNPDENVIVIAQGPVKKEEAPEISSPKPMVEKKSIPNYQKWIQYFFQ